MVEAPQLFSFDYPFGRTRSEFNLCMRAVRCGWLPEPEAAMLLQRAIEYSIEQKVSVRQILRLMSAFTMHYKRMFRTIKYWISQQGPEAEEIYRLLVESGYFATFESCKA